LNYILKEDKKYDYMDRISGKSVSVGDLISLNGDKYLVRKMADKNKFSLLKLVSKDEGEINFKLNNRYFNVLKNAVVLDCSNARIIEKYGERIINEFERAKHLQEKAGKAIIYQVGNIILINNCEYLIIDITPKYLILIDPNRKLSKLHGDKKHRILYTKSKQEVASIKDFIGYNETKKQEVLGAKNKR